jgi:hypothetical protein
MYSYPPYSDEEGAATDFGGAHDYPPQAYWEDQWAQVQQPPQQQQSESHGMGDAILSLNGDQVRLLFDIN